MCPSDLGVLTYKEVLGERSTGENDLLRSVLVTHEGAFLVVLTYEEVFNGVQSTGDKIVSICAL